MEFFALPDTVDCIICCDLLKASKCVNFHLGYKQLDVIVS